MGFVDDLEYGLINVLGFEEEDLNKKPIIETICKFKGNPSLVSLLLKFKTRILITPLKMHIYSIKCVLAHLAKYIDLYNIEHSIRMCTRNSNELCELVMYDKGDLQSETVESILKALDIAMVSLSPAEMPGGGDLPECVKRYLKEISHGLAAMDCHRNLLFRFWTIENGVVVRYAIISFCYHRTHERRGDPDAVNNLVKQGLDYVFTFSPDADRKHVFFNVSELSYDRVLDICEKNDVDKDVDEKQFLLR